MKTLASLLLALTMVFALTACGADKNTDEENKPPAVVVPEEEDALPEGGNDSSAGEVPDAVEQPDVPAEQPPANNVTTPPTNSGSTNNKPSGGSSTEKPSSETSEKPSTGGSSSTQPVQPPANQPTTGDSSSADKGDLTSLMGQLLKGTEDEMTVSTEAIAADAFQSNLFIDYIDGAKAVSSNALMSAVAHSVCLLQVPEGSDAAKIAAQIDANKDPRKWVCVEAEKSVVLQKGNYILLAMSTSDIVNTVSKNFKAIF